MCDVRLFRSAFIDFLTAKQLYEHPYTDDAMYLNNAAFRKGISHIRPHPHLTLAGVGLKIGLEHAVQRLLPQGANSLRQGFLGQRLPAGLLKTGLIHLIQPSGTAGQSSQKASSGCPPPRSPGRKSAPAPLWGTTWGNLYQTWCGPHRSAQYSFGPALG